MASVHIKNKDAWLKAMLTPHLCVFSLKKLALPDSPNDADDLMGMRQALPLLPLPDNFDPSVPPTSGEEYLQHVKFESFKYASVFVAERVDEDVLNARCDPQIPQKAQINSGPWAPSLDWQQEQVCEFSKLRHRILALRLKQSPNNKQDLAVPDVAAASKHWYNFLRSHKPLLSVLFAMRQEQLERALRVLLERHSQASLTTEQGAWVYAIAASLDHPLSREACGDLRDIARKCAVDRESRANLNDQAIMMMNLIITLVVDYFRQKDLCDAP